MPSTGLSPLARGTPGSAAAARRHSRFIPAGAGNTRSSIAVVIRDSVYPRWRGEHGRWPVPAECNAGLSPLARGTPPQTAAFLRSPRFIPAGAGNTPSEPGPWRQHSVYPRWRGEHTVGRISYAAGNGLSPLARGTLQMQRRRHDRWRFIPAGAGNTNEQQEIQPKQCGLSPLARGTRRSGMGHDAGDRFIPAGAGNTMKNRLRMVGAPVYPRWRGEHGVYDLREDHTDGLSPLARGTLLPAGLISKVERFIPAGAGNTSLEIRFKVAGDGLSPLARGTLLRRRRWKFCRRFIPAGAGNTLKIYYCFIIAF